MWRWATEGKLHQFFFGSPFTVLFCWFVSTLPFFLTRLFSAFTHRRERSKKPGGRQSGRRRRERKPFYDFQIELPFRLPGLPRSKKHRRRKGTWFLKKRTTLYSYSPSQNDAREMEQEIASAIIFKWKLTSRRKCIGIFIPTCVLAPGIPQICLPFCLSWVIYGRDGNPDCCEPRNATITLSHAHFWVPPILASDFENFVGKSWSRARIKWTENTLGSPVSKWPFIVRK